MQYTPTQPYTIDKLAFNDTTGMVQIDTCHATCVSSYHSGSFWIPASFTCDAGTMLQPQLFSSTPAPTTETVNTKPGRIVHAGVISNL